MAHGYRERIYLRKDILLKLYEYGEMNQSKLMSVCGLNNVKHKGILDSMVNKQLIERRDEYWGHKTVYKYKIAEKGKTLLEDILQRYEDLFPREDPED
jgi:predicted transcriptional regulator